MAEQRTHITDEGSLRLYRTEIPNTVIRGIRSKGLSVYAKWLYVYLKSVSGDNGECFRTTTTISKESGLPRGTVSRAKTELAHQHLIRITKGTRQNRDTDRVTIVNIWKANFQEFDEQCSLGEHQQDIDIQQESISSVPWGNASVPPGNASVPITASKKIPLKKIPDKKEEGILLGELGEKPSASHPHAVPEKVHASKRKAIHHRPQPELTPRQLIELYNAEIPYGHPQVEIFSEARLKNAAKALQHYPAKDFWLQVFEEIHLSRFMQGKGPPRDGQKKPWIATFDQLMARGKNGVENYLKAYEGAYRDAEATQIPAYTKRKQKEGLHATQEPDY